MTKEEALEKVKKLLNLANDKAASEGEVQNAMAMAQQIMAKFHIESVTFDDEPEEVTDFEIQENTKGLSSNRAILCSYLAKHYRCKLYRRGPRIHVVGFPTDVKIFTEVFEFAYAAFVKLANKHIEQYSTRTEKIKAKNTYLLGFGKGCIEALIQNENEFALVLVVPQEVEAKMQSLHLVKGSASVKKYLLVTRTISEVVGYDAMRKPKTKQLTA